MKVDGSKFKEARLAIKNGTTLESDRKKRYDAKYARDTKKTEESKNDKTPRIGTQAWLANEANVDERTIQNLENANTANQETIDAVSPHLGINGNQYIYGHGERHIMCGANKYVDFRPLICPAPGDAFVDSNLMVTIDPLFIEFSDIDLDSVTLNEIKASIDFLDCDFTWWSYVNISPKSDWLGQTEETHQLTIEDHNVNFWPIMFKQESFPNLSWRDFVNKVESSELEYFEIKIKLIFSYFEKEFSIKLERKEIENNFSVSRNNYNSVYPYRVQVRPLVLT